MTLMEVIRLMEAVAANQPAINLIVQENVYKLNDRPDCKYGAFVWTQGTHTAGVNADVVRYSFTLFYVDRLNADRSNNVEIQSVGVEVLGNILRTLAEEMVVSDWRITPFSSQRFADECSGVYCTVELEVPINSPCGATYDYYVYGGAYDFSFSDAFNVWMWQSADKTVFII